MEFKRNTSEDYQLGAIGKGLAIYLLALMIGSIIGLVVIFNSLVPDTKTYYDCYTALTASIIIATLAFLLYYLRKELF